MERQKSSQITLLPDETLRAGIRQILAEFTEVISMHGFYLDRTDNAIRFDVVTDFEVRDSADSQ